MKKQCEFPVTNLENSPQTKIFLHEEVAIIRLIFPQTHLIINQIVIYLIDVRSIYMWIFAYVTIRIRRACCFTKHYIN